MGGFSFCLAAFTTMNIKYSCSGKVYIYTNTQKASQKASWAGRHWVGPTWAPQASTLLPGVYRKQESATPPSESRSGWKLLL